MNAGNGQGTRPVDRADAGVRDGQRDELDMELVWQVDVGDVQLLPGDARLTTDAANGPADHWSTGGCGTSDSGVWRTATRGSVCAVSAGPVRGSLDGIEDLQVAAAATEVAGQALLDLPV